MIWENSPVYGGVSRMLRKPFGSTGCCMLVLYVIARPRRQAAVHNAIKGLLMVWRWCETLAVVSIVQNADVELAVQEAISLVGGIEDFVRPHDKVVIKPNVVFAMPSDTGFTTDPRVVQAIVELCRRVNPSEVTIAEGSAGTDTRLAFEMCGYSELARKHDVELVDLNESQTKTVDVPDGKALQEIRVPRIILESDVLINVPKLKLYDKRLCHSSSDSASLSLKNLMGAVPGRAELSQNRSPETPHELSREFWAPDGKFFLPHHQQWWGPKGERKRVHKDFAEGIVDLNTVIQASLNVIDGMIVPTNPSISSTKGERPLELNTILAGRDPLALDCIATKIGGMNPLDIPYLRRAAERGIGESDYNRIQVVGTPLNKIAEAWKTGVAELQRNS